MVRLAGKRAEAHEETTRHTASRVSVRHATKRADITDLETVQQSVEKGNGARLVWSSVLGRHRSGPKSLSLSVHRRRLHDMSSTVEIAGKRVHRLRWPGMLQRTGCYVLA